MKEKIYKSSFKISKKVIGTVHVRMRVIIIKKCSSEIEFGLFYQKGIDCKATKKSKKSNVKKWLRKNKCACGDCA